jgi:hypothetical protein
MLGKRHSNETKRKISEAIEGNKNSFGKPRTTESKQNISNSLKGRKLSEDHRKNISKATSGKNNPMSRENRLKRKNNGELKYG